jgi:hypothetical protein
MLPYALAFEGHEQIVAGATWIPGKIPAVSWYINIRWESPAKNLTSSLPEPTHNQSSLYQDYYLRFDPPSPQNKRRGNKRTLMMPLASIMVLLHVWVNLPVYVIPKRAPQELGCLQRLLTPYKGEHLDQVWTSQHAPISLKDKPLDSHNGWLKISGSPG